MQERTQMNELNGIESLLSKADFSAETDLKERLREKLGLSQVRETSFDELSEKLGMKRDAIHNDAHVRSKENSMEKTDNKVKSFGGMNK